MLVRKCYTCSSILSVFWNLLNHLTSCAWGRVGHDDLPTVTLRHCRILHSLEQGHYRQSILSSYITTTNLSYTLSPYLRKARAPLGWVRAPCYYGLPMKWASAKDYCSQSASWIRSLLPWGHITSPGTAAIIWAGNISSNKMKLPVCKGTQSHYPPQVHSQLRNMLKLIIQTGKITKLGRRGTQLSWCCVLLYVPPKGF